MGRERSSKSELNKAHELYPLCRALRKQLFRASSRRVAALQSQCARNGRNIVRPDVGANRLLWRVACTSDLLLAKVLEGG